MIQDAARCLRDRYYRRYPEMIGTNCVDVSRIKDRWIARSTYCIAANRLSRNWLR